MFELNTNFLDPLISLPGGTPVAFGVLFIISIVISYALSSFFIKIFSFLSRRTKTTLDDEILKRLKTPLFVFFFLTAVEISTLSFYPETQIFDKPVNEIYIILIFIIIAFAINRIIDALLIWYGREIAVQRKKREDREAFPFVRNLVKIIIYLAFLIIVLERLGIAVAPLLAGLGIAGLAVALALQDTLSNFFAGLHILADKPVREGDLVRLENGLEGNIENIGWRSTKILKGDNTHVIIPNAKLAQSIITNLSTPNEKTAVTYEVGVDYKEDVDTIEKIIFDVLKKVQKDNPDIVKDSEPWVRFDKFGDYALIFKYGYMVTNYNGQFAALKAVNRELFYAFKKNKINIPFPVRTIYSEKKKK